MNKAQLIDKMAVAIRSADSTYFNENYTKQAAAAFKALEKAGYTVIPTDYPKDIWQKAADAMKTGSVKPADHVKNVYETVLKLAKAE
jgi:hypothetical protein